MDRAEVCAPARVSGDVSGGPGYFNKAACRSVPTAGKTGPTNAGAGTLSGTAGQGIILGPGQFNGGPSLIR